MEFLEQGEFDQQTCFFLDPPWGGPDYKQYDKLQLSLGKYNIPEICTKIYSKCSKLQLIVLKLPNNFDFDSLFDTGLNNLVRIKYASPHALSLVFLSSLDPETLQKRVLDFPWTLEDAALIYCAKEREWEKKMPARFMEFVQQKKQRRAR